MITPHYTMACDKCCKALTENSVVYVTETVETIIKKASDLGWKVTVDLPYIVTVCPECKSHKKK